MQIIITLTLVCMEMMLAFLPAFCHELLGDTK